MKKIPADKIVRIDPFNRKVTKTAEAVIRSIKEVYPDLEVKHMGASALGISGQNDLDIYAFSKPSDFGNYLLGLIKLFGEPLHKHETFIEWKFNKDGFDIELYLTALDSPTMKRQIAVFEILKSNKKLLKEYEKLKFSMDGKSFKEYQRKKYEFYNRILTDRKHKIKKDNYRKVRGGTSQLFNIFCAKCGKQLLTYQKDGKGTLLRLYFDRIVEPVIDAKRNLTCTNCKTLIGLPMVYKQEKRLAFRLVRGSFFKKRKIGL